MGMGATAAGGKIGAVCFSIRVITGLSHLPVIL